MGDDPEIAAVSGEDAARRDRDEQSRDPQPAPTVAERLQESLEKFLTPPIMPLSNRDITLLQSGTELTLLSGLAATVWGDGPPVLLAHGWGCRRTHWGAFIVPLAKAGFRVVSVDAPAHGDSTGQFADVASFANGLLETGRELGPLAAIVGYSFGAGASALALSRGLVAERAVFLSGP